VILETSLTMVLHHQVLQRNGRGSLEGKRGQVGLS
jgi:hypothetical protein